MKFIMSDKLLFEELNRSETNMTTEQFLTSKELHQELQNVFGDEYYKNKICHQVCKAVEEMSEDKEVHAITNILVYLKTEDNYELVSSKGHCVILYRDKLYDYTSDQYVNSGVDEVNGLRILSETKDIKAFDDMDIGDARVFEKDNYIILLI